MGIQASEGERSIYVENPDLFDILEQELNRGKRVKPKPTPTPAKLSSIEPVKEQEKIKVKEVDPLEDLPKTKTIKVTTPYGVVEEIDMEFDKISKGPTMPLLMSLAASEKTQEETKEPKKRIKDSKKEPKRDEWR